MNRIEEELKVLLGLYKKGHIDADVVIEEFRELNEQRLAEALAAAKPAETRTAKVTTESTAVEKIEAKPQTVAKPVIIEPDFLSRLDSYRAAEESGAETLRRWAEKSDNPEVAGGLRVLAAREQTHADLLRERLEELGYTPSAKIPIWLAEYNKALLAERATDGHRFAALVEQFPSIEDALSIVRKDIERAADDRVTAGLLKTILADERASLEWIHAKYVELCDPVDGSPTLRN